MVENVYQTCLDYDWKGRSKTISRRKENYGLARNIIEGVTEVINAAGRVIVLEDDLETSPGFLDYMNNALQLYKDERRVMHIAGYMFPIDLKTKEETLFYQVTSCWGWATWADRWKHLDTNPTFLFEELKKRKMESWFDLDDSGVFLHQLEYNITGRFKTWAIKWQASVNLKDGLSLHPKKSLVRNIGFDNSGEHCPPNKLYTKQSLANDIKVQRQDLHYNSELRNKMKRYYKAGNQGQLQKIKNRIKATVRSKLKL